MFEPNQFPKLYYFSIQAEWNDLQKKLSHLQIMSSIASNVPVPEENPEREYEYNFPSSYQLLTTSSAERRICTKFD